MREAARAAGRLAALRGLRALSVHAGGDQERDPDPVRDRLPARLRRGAAGDLRPPADRVRARGRARGRAARRRVRFLQAAGERHEARRAPARARRRRARASSPTAASASVRVRGRARHLRGPGAAARPSRCDEPGLWRVRACVHNTTEVEARRLERSRGAASPACSRPTSCSRPSAGRFVSPLERDGASARRWPACENVNTFPVLAVAGRRRGARRGDRAARPSRDRAARASATCSTTPRSRRRCCSTCRRCRDAEREAIAAQDPAVRGDDRARRRAPTPRSMLALHGLIEELGDPVPSGRARAARRSGPAARARAPEPRRGRARARRRRPSARAPR